MRYETPTIVAASLAEDWADRREHPAQTMKEPLILAVDQGTTSSRAMVFDAQNRVVASSQKEFPQVFPNDGWVEHDPEALWRTTTEVMRQAVAEAEAGQGKVVSMGITNQRETTIVWDRETGLPLYNAIVWQDRRTSELCDRLARDADVCRIVASKTGLLLDPYFSASKIAWILDHVDGARAKANQGKLAFGTVDSFLVWRLTGGEVHATDATNASRTSLFDITTGEWDRELLEVFNIPSSVLPTVLDSNGNFGITAAGLLPNTIPIRGVAGDQQAAAIGQCCFTPGSVKSTYGTGCFVLMNTGAKLVSSQNRLLSTIAYRIDGTVRYALEGSIFIAGAAVQWLRDELGVVEQASATESVAKALSDNGGVYLVPAFTGLGAPHWDPQARGAILGLTRGTGASHIVRAALESVCYQTADLFAAMAADGVEPAVLRVDGGMVENVWLLQFLSDILNIPIERPQVMETTALGAAYLAGRGVGVFGTESEWAQTWCCDRSFTPDMADQKRSELLGGWHGALQRVLSV